MDDTIHLDSIDGFEFEDVCKRILEGLACRVEKIGGVADGGRDLIAHSEQNTIVVECKHQPGSFIGRPVVQKLHSAVITSKASAGMIMTTGQFSKEALEHAEVIRTTTNLTIKLVDKFILADMAEKAGLRLLRKGDSQEATSFPMLDFVTVAQMTAQLIHVDSSPHSLQQLITIANAGVNLQPGYLVKADIHQDFRISNDRIIYSVSQSNNTLLLDSKGALYPWSWISFLGRSPLQRVVDLPNMTKGIFNKNARTIKAIAVKFFVDKFSKQITYKSSNNRIYNKACKIKPRNVQIRDLKQIYIPHYDLVVQVLKTRYRFGVLQNGRKAFITQQDMRSCSICLRTIRNRVILCNECGRLGHRSSIFWWKNHGFRCGGCHKTVCKNCGRIQGFFKRQFCLDCVSSVSSKTFD